MEQVKKKNSRNAVALEPHMWVKLLELKEKTNIRDNTKAITFAISYLLRVIDKYEAEKK